MTVMTKEAAIDFFAALYRGKHHIPSDVREDGGCFSVSHYGYVSTYDYDELTRLVLLAHERCVRAWISSSGPRHIRIFIAQRDPSKPSMCEWHPTIDQAVAKFREADDQPWVRRHDKIEKEMAGEAELPWNFCPKCKQDVQDDMRTGEYRDGSECTCIGCGTVYVATAYEGGLWMLREYDAELEDDDGHR